MTEEQIRAASERELDRALGMALGWTFSLTDKQLSPNAGAWSNAGGIVGSDLWWEPSRRIALCFSEVIPAMRAKGWLFSLNEFGDNTQLRFVKAVERGAARGECEVPQGEEATGICRASLLALLGEESK